jgi:hypothetical protein
MGSKQFLAVIAMYRAKFEEMSVGKIDYPHDKRMPARRRGPGLRLEHCHGMLEQMEKFIAQGSTGKADRWLGFIQGVLWSEGIYTLKEMRDHNRPTE